MITTILTICGGLALFLYGIRVLSGGMEQLAGSKLQQWLDKATNRPIKGALFGAGATAVLQSSSLLMVTMIGLINGGLLSLEQAVGVMLGQEIGTTFTGQLIAFDIGIIKWIALAGGIVLLEFGNNRKTKTYAQIAIGFGILFVGMETMSGTLRQLTELAVAQNFLASMARNPLLGVLAGTILTAVIQSSSATTALVIAMGAEGIIALPGAVGIILGANIGTCVTGFIASLGATPTARRASIAQILINVAGVLIFIPFITPYSELLAQTSGSLARQIANSHTVFNVLVSVALFPFVKSIVRLTERIVPDKPELEEESVAEYIDENLKSLPSFGISQAQNEVVRMGELVADMLAESKQALLNGDLEQAERVLVTESETIDPLCNLIENFVDNLINEDLNANERKLCFQIKNANVDLERVGDHTENLAEAAQDVTNHHAGFSEEAMQGLERVFDHAELTLRTALAAYKAQDPVLAEKACMLEDDMDHLNLEVRSEHLERLKAGDCSPESSALFIETLRNLERICDHADNLAISVLRKS